MDRCRENVIEFLTGEKWAAITFSQGRYKSRIKKLADRYPEECQIVIQNKDGSLYAHIPVSWIKINPPKQLTKEQKKRRAEVLRKNIKKRRL